MTVLFVTALIFVSSAEDLSALRAQQNQAIDDIRKGDFSVIVTDQDGSLVPGATVEFEMLEHDFRFGMMMNPDMATSTSANGQKYRDTVKTYFNHTVDGWNFEWVTCEGSRDNVRFSPADNVVNWAKENGLTIRGHALAWGVGSDVPRWQESLNKSELQAEMIERVDDVYDYYGDTTFTDIDVINEMCPGLEHSVESSLDGTFYHENAGWDGVAAMYNRTREKLNCPAYVNEYDILSGGYAWTLSHVIDSIEAHGGTVDGVGMQAHTLKSVNTGTCNQILNHFWNNYQTRITLTEIIVAGPTESGGYADTVQMNNLDRLMRLGFAHTAMDAMLFWGFWQTDFWSSAVEGCWWYSNWTPRPVVTAYKDLVFDEWWSDTSVTTGSNGVGLGRVFYGDYRITVTAPGDAEAKNGTYTMTRSDSTKEITIQLDGEYAGIRDAARQASKSYNVEVRHDRSAGRFEFNILNGNSFNNVLSIYNIKGQRVWQKELANQYSAAWNYNADRHVPNGTYIARIDNGAHVITRKVAIIR